MSDHGSAYHQAGVDYHTLDAGKVSAVAAALTTSSYARAEVTPRDATRGESAFVFDLDGVPQAIVLECLGTKSEIAHDYQDATGENRFADIGIDAVAAIVNDLCAIGARPAVINAYFATGKADWYEVPGRYEALVEGWKHGCEKAQAVWGGGESPMLAGIINPNSIDIAGCAVGGFAPGVTPLTSDRITAGDEIVLVEANGIHANGASLVRAAAAKIGGIATPVHEGASLGELALVPSVLYSNLVDRALAAEINVSYMSHLTGHGLRKLMRPTHDWTYVIDEVLPSQPIFEVVNDIMRLDAREAYSTFNMGQGLAVYVRAGQGTSVVQVAAELGLTAIVAGHIDAGPRAVHINPLGITFTSDELAVR